MSCSVAAQFPLPCQDFRMGFLLVGTGSPTQREANLHFARYELNDTKAFMSGT